MTDVLVARGVVAQLAPGESGRSFELHARLRSRKLVECESCALPLGICLAGCLPKGVWSKGPIARVRVRCAGYEAAIIHYRARHVAVCIRNRLQLTERPIGVHSDAAGPGICDLSQLPERVAAPGRNEVFGVRDFQVSA